MEVGIVEEVFDPAAAACFGVEEGRVTVMIHSGSRGLGYQVCDDYLALMNREAGRLGFDLPDRQLCCAPVNSPEGQDYLGAMAAAVNFAFCNRQMITHWTRQAFAEALGARLSSVNMAVVYEVAHNIAKIEEHLVNGKKKKVCVHRKGATRALGPGHPDLPARFRDAGQPVIIPGDMGRCSYVLCGGTRSAVESFGSACHGAGRLLGRSQARALSTGKAVAKELAAKGITLRAASLSDVPEEASYAYKDVADVVGVVERAGLARRVARLQPLVVVKG